MKPLIIKATEYSPQITFDPKQNKFEISGESRPEDAGKLFTEVLRWLEEYSKELKTQKQTTLQIRFEFKLLYFNTISAKYILEILRKLQTCQADGVSIKIMWYYKTKDEDMKEAGDEFARLVNMPFEFVLQ
jgi:hypothetical protein